MKNLKLSVSRRAIIRGMTDSAQAALMMLQGDRDYAFDANMGLSDGAASYTASGYAQYGGAQGIVDLGGNQGVTITLPSIANSASIIPQQARIDAVVPIWVTGGLFTGTTLFRVFVVGSNDPNFGATLGVAVLGCIEFGNTAGQDIVNGITTPAPASIGGSMYEIPFTNEQNNVKYEYISLYHTVANSATLTYRAFVAVLARE